MKIFIIIILSFSFGFAHAQSTSTSVTNNKTFFHPELNYQDVWNSHFGILGPQQQSYFKVPASNLLICTPNHLTGMFCKMEYQIETKSKFAPRFRLGSLNYTNWMEGKGEYYSRYWK